MQCLRVEEHGSALHLEAVRMGPSKAAPQVKVAGGWSDAFHLSNEERKMQYRSAREGDVGSASMVLICQS